jgi:hypothetical protein
MEWGERMAFVACKTAATQKPTFEQVSFPVLTNTCVLDIDTELIVFKAKADKPGVDGDREGSPPQKPSSIKGKACKAKAAKAKAKVAKRVAEHSETPHAKAKGKRLKK